MLPPKLAQIIINLAVGLLPEEARQSVCEIPPDEPIPPAHFDQVMLDPFCGTGVTLLEAYLDGYGVYGTDIDSRMIDYSLENLRWLAQNFNPGGRKSRVETGDATQYEWRHEFDFVATETYLGRPFTEQPAPEILTRTISECNLIIKKFLRNIHRQAKPGMRFCVAVPAWQIKPGQFKHLPLIDQISDLGYNQVKFEHVNNENLLYYRPDQIVARELLILTRK
jgi:tRNA G10  N-methylase Trm11